MLSHRNARGRPGIVRDGAGIPDQRSLRMRDEKARHGHLCRGEFFLLESVARRIGVVKSATIKYVQSEGLRRPYVSWSRWGDSPAASGLSSQYEGRSGYSQER